MQLKRFKCSSTDERNVNWLIQSILNIEVHDKSASEGLDIRSQSIIVDAQPC